MDCKNADIRQGVEPATYLVTIGASAGGFHALSRLLSGVRRDSEAALAVAMHTGDRSVLVEALAPRSPLPVCWAESGKVLRAGVVYLAPPCQHLVVNPDGCLTLVDAPRVRFFRPSADWLFHSAAGSYEDRHIAIVLSGRLSDGAASLRAVRRAGGTVLAQDPATCLYPGMPTAAIATGTVNTVLPVDAMPEVIDGLLRLRDPRTDWAAWQEPFRV